MFTKVDVPLDELRAEIARLTASNSEQRSPDTEKRLVDLRHRAGIRLVEAAPAAPEFAAPDDALPEGDPLPEFHGSLTPGQLRAAILRDGCALVRGLVDRDRALELAEEIDRAFAVRASRRARRRNDGYYSEFKPQKPYKRKEIARPWIKLAGGLLAIDSPRLNFEFMELLAAAGIPALVGDYLGEPAVISVQKTTLRKAEPTVVGGWHQDGYFLGPVRSLNLWLSLSHCGDEAPGLDVVPRRIDEYAETLDQGPLRIRILITDEVVAEIAGDTPIVRPIFEPGDALLFDETFLHRTASDPSMPNPRYAVENWFFGASAFPADYTPFAV